MGLPGREWYDVWDLIERWKSEKKDEYDIYDWVTTCKLEMWGRRLRVTGDGWTSWLVATPGMIEKLAMKPHELFTDSEFEFRFSRAEINLFEKKHGLNQPVDDMENRPPENPIHYVQRRLAENTTREVIALELDAQGVKVDVISRLLCTKELSGHADTDDYATLRKRGYDLLAKAKKMNK